MPSLSARLQSFLSELKHRRVFRVAVGYAVVAWCVVQVAFLALPALLLPESLPRAVLVLALLGFPIAVVLAWAYDITPEGVSRTGALSTASSPDAKVRASVEEDSSAAVAVPRRAIHSGRAGPYSPLESDFAESRSSIAVLPFASLSGDTDDEYFSDGITEDIITRLSTIRSLKVISRTSVMRFKGSNESIREIGRTLGAATVLEGTVRRSGERLRVTAQLIDSNSDVHLWAEAYDRELTDIFNVQAEIAEAIAGALRVKFSRLEGSRLRHQPGTDIETYNLCLLGRHYWHRWTEPDFRTSIDYYEEAIARDPSCAAAHLGLGLGYGTLALGYWSVRGRDFYALAKHEVTRALELDPYLAEGHAWLGAWESQHEYAWEAAERRLRKAVALEPNSATAHDAYGWLLTANGRFHEARRESARASVLDPLSYFVAANAALQAYRRREYDKAVDLSMREIALDPNLPMGHALLALPLLQSGRCEEAIGTIRHALTLGYAIAEPFLAMALAMAGRTEEARDILNRIEARRDAVHAWPFALAMAYAALEDAEHAFARLEEAYEERDFWMTWLAVEPGLDAVRNDPRYDELLGKVRLGSKPLSTENRNPLLTG